MDDKVLREYFRADAIAESLGMVILEGANGGAVVEMPVDGRFEIPCQPGFELSFY